jgi:hypothetical protein
MSKGKTPNIDDLSPVQNSNNEDEVEELELEPGDSFVGEVRSIERGLGDYDSTLVHFATEQLGEQRKYWLPGHVDAQFYKADIEEGQVVGLIKDEEPTTGEDDDGEGFEYHAVEVRC